MNRLNKYLLIIVFATLWLGLNAQSEKKLVRKGNKQFEEKEYSEAEIEYRKAVDKNPSYNKSKFNLAGAMYKQDNYEESGNLYNEAAELSKDSQVKADSYYNMGNSLLSAKKYKESMEAFKNSLRLNPDNKDAKYNYEYARQKLIQQQQQQQNKDQNKDQDKDKDKNKDQNKDQNKDKNKDQKDQNKDKKQDDQQNKEKNDQQQNKDQNGQDKDQQKQQQQQEPQQISKKDAQRMLDALKNDEKKTLQKLQKAKAKAAKSSKTEIDW